MAKLPIHFISGKPFQIDKIWMIWPLKRPNGNHEMNSHSKGIPHQIIPEA